MTEQVVKLQTPCGDPGSGGYLSCLRPRKARHPIRVLRPLPSTINLSLKLRIPKGDQRKHNKDHTKTKQGTTTSCKHIIPESLLPCVNYWLWNLLFLFDPFFFWFPFFRAAANTEPHHARFLTHTLQTRFTWSLSLIKFGFRSQRENNGLRYSSAGILHKNDHVIVATRFRDVPKET